MTLLTAVFAPLALIAAQSEPRTLETTPLFEPPARVSGVAIALDRARGRVNTGSASVRSGRGTRSAHSTS